MRALERFQNKKKDKRVKNEPSKEKLEFIISKKRILRVTQQFSRI